MSNKLTLFMFFFILGAIFHGTLWLKHKKLSKKEGLFFGVCSIIAYLLATGVTMFYFD